MTEGFYKNMIISLNILTLNYCRKVVFITSFLLLPVLLYGQSFNKLIKQGNKHYNRGQVNLALESYLQAEEIEPGNVELNFYIGRTYLVTEYKHKALSYLLKVSKLAPNIDPYLEYFLGVACQHNYLFEEAVVHFNNFGNLHRNNKDLALQKIKECHNADSLIRTPVAVDIQNLGSAINSPEHEYVPIITPDESILVFTSRREGSTGGLRTKDNELYEDIYISHNLGNGKWSEAKPISRNVNTDFHDATAGISADGKSLYLYREDGEGDIFLSTFDGRDWSDPKPLPYPINTNYWETGLSVTPDGQTVYFSSDRPGGYGGLDIYRSTKQPDGSWGAAENLGPKINTVGHEDSPFIHPDLQTLFFSSDGHPGLGGYDVFKSEWKDGEWQQPENMGYPINSPDNNFHFIMTGDRKHGYYSSVQEGGYGKSDIYRITFLDLTLQPLLEAPRQSIARGLVLTKEDSLTATAYYSGQLLSARDDQPLSGLVSISHLTTGELIAETEAGEDGHFTIIIPEEGTYGLSAEVKGYLIHSRKINLTKQKEQQKIVTRIRLNPIEVGTTAIMANIFFDFGKASLQTESISELEKIKEFLNNIPTLRLQINGHTDNVGNANANKVLSRRRAQAVVDYLVQNGISADRLSVMGYGQERPLVSNDDEEEGRELNRRTEIEVISF
jgi:outer membrane protein OmpA-like peptidoglycan-associated protein/tetratricopeptide (TPR) repeat protein